MGDALLVGGGVTSPAEARLASSGLLAVQGPGVFDIRTGVLAAPGSTALITGTSDTGPMTVAIAPHVAVTTRGAANGPYIGPALEAITKVTIGAAPASGSRIDVVYVKQQDATAGVPTPDATTAPAWAVAQGQASTTPPVKPSIPIGAEELGTVTVAAGATSTNGTGVTIANTARQTALRGGTVSVADQAEIDALATYDTRRAYRRDVRREFEYFDGAWHLATPSTVPPVFSAFTEAPGTYGNNPTTITSLTVPTLGTGVPYRLMPVFRAETGSDAAGGRWDIRVLATFNSADYLLGRTQGRDGAVSYQEVHAIPSSQVFTGQVTCRAESVRGYGTTLGRINGGADRAFGVVQLPA